MVKKRRNRGISANVGYIEKKAPSSTYHTNFDYLEVGLANLSQFFSVDAYHVHWYTFGSTVVISDILFKFH